MITTLPLGINREPSPVLPGKRPRAQYEAVEKIVTAPGFLHCSSLNPFGDEILTLTRCTFYFMYYVEVDGKTQFRVVKINPKGRIIDVTPDIAK